MGPRKNTKQQCGSEIARAGMLVHEMGHMLGLPDLYGNPNKPGIGLGVYDPMAYAGGHREKI